MENVSKANLINYVLEILFLSFHLELKLAQSPSSLFPQLSFSSLSFSLQMQMSSQSHTKENDTDSTREK